MKAEYMHTQGPSNPSPVINPTKNAHRSSPHVIYTTVHRMFNNNKTDKLWHVHTMKHFIVVISREKIYNHTPKYG